MQLVEPLHPLFCGRHLISVHYHRSFDRKFLLSSHACKGERALRATATLNVEHVVWRRNIPSDFVLFWHMPEHSSQMGGWTDEGSALP